MKRILIVGDFTAKEWIDIANHLYGKVLVSYKGVNSNSIISKTYDVIDYDKEYLKSIRASVQEIGRIDVDSKYKQLSNFKLEMEEIQKKYDDVVREVENYNTAMIDYAFYSRLGEYLNGKGQSKLYNDIGKHNTYNKKLHELLKQLHYKYEYKDGKLCILGK